MLAHWCLSSNFGDQLTYWLVEKITKRAPKWTTPDDQRPHLLGVGSMLNHARKSSIVWGSGIANMTDTISPDANVRLVRGPLSALRLVTCGGKYCPNHGDPGLLCSMFRPPAAKKHKLGFVPHYIDNSVWCIDGAHQIDVLAPVDQVLDEITSCEAIISTSLHGLVVADAYGIPATWMYSPRVLGDGTKFADHLLAVGGSVTPPLTWGDVANKKADQVIKLIPKRTVVFSHSILNTFPRELA